MTTLLTSKFAEVTLFYVSFPSKLYLTWINLNYCFEFTLTGNTSVKYISHFLSLKTETHLHEKKHEHGVVRQRLEILLIIDLCSIFFQDQVHLHKVLMALMTCIPDICQFWNTTALCKKACKKYARKCVILGQKGQNFALSLLKKTPAWKKYTTVGLDGCD